MHINPHDPSSTLGFTAFAKLSTIWVNIDKCIQCNIILKPSLIPPLTATCGVLLQFWEVATGASKSIRLHNFQQLHFG